MYNQVEEDVILLHEINKKSDNSIGEGEEYGNAIGVYQHKSQLKPADLLKKTCTENFTTCTISLGKGIKTEFQIVGRVHKELQEADELTPKFMELEIDWEDQTLSKDQTEGMYLLERMLIGNKKLLKYLGFSTKTDYFSGNFELNSRVKEGGIIRVPLKQPYNAPAISKFPGIDLIKGEPVKMNFKASFYFTKKDNIIYYGLYFRDVSFSYDDLVLSSEFFVSQK